MVARMVNWLMLIWLVLASQSAMSSELSDRIDRIVAAHTAPGAPGLAVIVSRNGEVLHRKAYGLANVAQAQPMRPEMVFRIGSVTKQFTAAAIMLLVEEGKLAVTDRITAHLPDYPEHGITIEHLLTHTSGIPNYTEKPGFGKIAAEQRDRAGMIALFRNDALEFAPGTRYKYSNSGYFLLGAIIEKASGQSYSAFLRSRIFKPLEMRSTGYGDNEVTEVARAAGHGKTSDGYNMEWPYAAGAVTSNIDDLARWGDAVRSRKLLREDSWRRIFQPASLADGTSSPYGYAWHLGVSPHGARWHHGGGIPGFRTETVLLPEHGIYIAVLCNMIGRGTPPLPDMVGQIMDAAVPRR